MLVTRGHIAYSFAGLVALMSLLVLVLPSAYSLDARWNTNHESYSHGYIILIAGMFFLARKFKQFNAVDITPSPLATLLFTAVVTIWLTGFISSTISLQQFSLPALFWLVIASIWGWKRALTCLFPIAIIYTVIPVWDIFNPALQAMTAAVCAWLLAFFGISVYIDGNFISIPAGEFVVASGCSGLNYLLMSVSYALFYGHLYYQNWRRSLLLTGIAIVSGILCNWTRVFFIILIGEWSNMESSIIEDHENFGLLVFGLFLIPLTIIARHLEPEKQDVVNDDQSDSIKTKIPAIYYSLPALLCIVIGYAHAVTGSNYATASILATEQYLNALKQNHWIRKTQNRPLSGSLHMGENQQINYLTHVIDFHSVHAHVAHYPEQNQRNEIISYSNRVFDDTVWEKIEDQSFVLNSRYLILRHKFNDAQTGLIYWYSVGRKQTTEPVTAKLLQAFEYLNGYSNAGFFSLEVNCVGSCQLNPKEWQNLIKDIQAHYLASLSAAKTEEEIENNVLD